MSGKMQNELASATKQSLIRAALNVRRNAYAPYSKFAVGAALLTSTGKIFSGVNVENISYGMTICAERSAIFAAVSQGFREFAAIAIATAGGRAPCGACRQVLAEFAPNLLVLLVDADQPEQPSRELRLSELLPHSFHFSGPTADWPSD